MGFVRRAITSALDLANLKRHNDNFADIETDLNAHDGRITTAQVDITRHKAATDAHAAETITYRGAVATAETVKEAIDSVKTELTQAIIAGDSGPEAAAARASVSGEVYDTLGDRLNAEYERTSAQLAEKVQRVSSVADLKAGNFRVGDVVQTLGYFFRADSGGGDYLISDNPMFVDDGGTVIDLNNGLKALLQYNKGFINVKQFGAVGNGQIDDTAAIKKALALLNTSFSDYQSTFYRGGVLFFPGGVYLITEPIVATLNVKFEGINAASFKGRYSGSRNASTLRFTLTDTSKPAIKFVGYDAFGNMPTGLYVSLEDTSTATMSSDNACMENINIDTTNNSMLGVALVNSTVARFQNVGVFNFKYGVMANNCWGSSFEKMFIIASYIPIIFYYGNNGVSLRDSYLTTSINDVIPSAAEIPVPELNMYQYPLATAGAMICGGMVTLDNVVIEGAAVAIKLINTIAAVRTTHAERIKTCLISSTGSKINFDTVYLFNQNTASIPLLDAATTSAHISNVNSSLTLSNIIDTSSNVTATNTDNMKLSDYASMIIVDKSVSKDITFDPAITVEVTAGNVYKKAYREGRTVSIGFRCSVATAPIVGTVITVGTVPTGFRPKINYSVNTYYGVLSINASTGAITFTVRTSNTFFLYESVSYGM